MARYICKRTLDIEFERAQSIGLGSMFGDCHTDTHMQTDRHTHFFYNTFIECGSDIGSKFIKKSKSNFLTIAILPSPY